MFKNYILKCKNKKKIIGINKRKHLISILNILISILNLIFLLRNSNTNTLEIIKIKSNLTILKKLKNVDIFIFSIISYSYHKLEKYFINISGIKQCFIFKKRKIIKYYGVNLFNQQIFIQNITSYIKKKYKLIFDKDNPDYLFFNVFSDEELNHKYNNCIKIAYFSENSIPDFSQCDYAIGHSHINYMDRYFKFPLSYIWALKGINFIKLLEIRNNTLFNQRKKFCAAVISDVFPNCNDFFRLDFIKELNKYKKVDMGGKYNNTVGGLIRNKRKFLLDYKFSIAMENTNGDGYVTEKIIDSFISGTIPIYYGDYMIDEYINPKTYILIKDSKDMYDKIEYIKKIDNDNKLYENIMKENVFKEKNLVEKIEKEHSDFLVHIFEQDKSKAKRM